MKKFFANVIVILIACAAIFFIGWVQFLVKPGYCGVLTSKTSGIHKEALVSGKFAWCWEKLLPTNAQVHLFSLSPYKSRQTEAGMLPSGELYASKLGGNADFSYKLDMEIALELSPEKIHELFSANKISSQNDLNSWYNSKAKLVSAAVADKVIKQKSAESPLKSVVFSDAELASLSAEFSSELEGGKISSVEISSAKIPDFELYEMAKNSYSAYQKELDAKLKELASAQAKTLAEENRSMQQLEKFANLLKEYPQLESLAKSDNFSQIINALNTAR
ncbi:MAG: hypothetical protein II558_03295 [Treponema sp.]|nr:hypothetical protein [Treponema sp.]